MVYQPKGEDGSDHQSTQQKEVHMRETHEDDQDTGRDCPNPPSFGLPDHVVQQQVIQWKKHNVPKAIVAM